MNALTILQSYLDEVGAAVLRGDWNAYEARVCLPFQLVTHTANLTVTTQGDLRAGFDAFVQTLRSQQVTDYIRLAEAAIQLDEALISGRYATHLMVHAHRILPPFRSEITLRLEGNRWRAASITNALANSRWPLLMPSVTDTPDGKGSGQ